MNLYLEVKMKIEEVQATEIIINQLIEFSKDWESENICYGYRANNSSDIEGNRIFIAMDGESIIGYLLGNFTKSKNMKAIMPENTPFFEVEELYVIPSCRSQGIGASLFNYVAETVNSNADYIVLSTATKNWRSVFHFYIDELEMNFWSARLYKKIR
jgi:ribosomal protein S18 acetylase RimI-like enzyme